MATRTGYYYDNDGDLRYESGAPMYRDNSGDFRQVQTGTPYRDSDGDIRYTNAPYKPAVAKPKPDPKAQADALLKQWYADEAARKKATQAQVSAITSKSQAAQKSAVQQFMEQTKKAAAAAKQTMKQPVAGVAKISANALKPLQAVTGVKLNSALQGGNAAAAQFYVSPTATQSQYNVGAPVGGNDIGVRQKATTAAITSKPGNLGSKRKDEM